MVVFLVVESTGGGLGGEVGVEGGALCESREAGVGRLWVSFSEFGLLRYAEGKDVEG